MSHLRVKTKYMVPDIGIGTYTMKERTLYAHHNLGSDCVTFYDEDGTVILFIEQDTEENNIIDAINRLWWPYKERAHGAAWTDDLNDGVEHMDLDDQKKCGI
jgi:hypothetical protein